MTLTSLSFYLLVLALLVLYYLLAPLLVRLGRRWGWLVLAAIGLAQVFLINVLHPGALGFTLPSQAQALVPPVLGRTLDAASTALRTRLFLPERKRCTEGMAATVPALPRAA